MRRARRDGTGNALDLPRSDFGPGVGQFPVPAVSVSPELKSSSCFEIGPKKSKTKRNLTVISGRRVASRAARPARKGRKGGPQRRGNEEGAGDALSLSQPPRRPGDGRIGAPPSLSRRRCNGPAGTAQTTRSTCQGLAAVQASTSPPFPRSPLLLHLQCGRRAAHVVRLDQKK